MRRPNEDQGEFRVVELESQVASVALLEHRLVVLERGVAGQLATRRLSMVRRGGAMRLPPRSCPGDRWRLLVLGFTAVPRTRHEAIDGAELKVHPSMCQSVPAVNLEPASFCWPGILASPSLGAHPRRTEPSTKRLDVFGFSGGNSNQIVQSLERSDRIGMRWSRRGNPEARGAHPRVYAH
jgi:hypothetical protein